MSGEYEYVNYEDKEKLNASKVTSMLNSFSFNDKEFCKAMSNEHKTLQQSFTRLCIEWLKTCANENYRTDGRNEASQKIARELLGGYIKLTGNTIDDIGVPYI